VITGLSSSEVSPFSSVKENLKKVSGFMDTASGRMEDIAQKCTEADEGLRAVKSLLQLVAP
jgi:hypothetical protein